MSAYICAAECLGPDAVHCQAVLGPCLTGKVVFCGRSMKTESSSIPVRLPSIGVEASTLIDRDGSLGWTTVKIGGLYPMKAKTDWIPDPGIRVV
jgi:hypothetical protein